MALMFIRGALYEAFVKFFWFCCWMGGVFLSSDYWDV